MISQEQSHPSALTGRGWGEIHFPVLIQALYLGTKPGTCWTRGCMKLLEDMPDPVREEERAATCLLHDQAAPSLHLVVSKQRWEGAGTVIMGEKAPCWTRWGLPFQMLGFFLCDISSLRYSTGGNTWFLNQVPKECEAYGCILASSTFIWMG